jgi:hypothetical protein
MVLVRNHEGHNKGSRIITKMLVNCARRWLDIDIIMAKIDFSK